MTAPCDDLCLCGCPAGDHVEDVFGYAPLAAAEYPCLGCVECGDYEAEVSTLYAADYPTIDGGERI